MTKFLRSEIATFRTFVRAVLAKTPVAAVVAVDQSDPCYEDSKMSHNRLQSLGGFGYRSCYLQKLREVAAATGSIVLGHEYWFHPSSSAASRPSKAGKSPRGGSVDVDTKSRLQQVIPNRARITSTRLQAYVDSLPKQEE